MVMWLGFVLDSAEGPVLFPGDSGLGPEFKLINQRFGPLRFAARRVFDFIRGVDGLIWTIILSRAFGPGPMTGAIAIALTDTGTDLTTTRKPNTSITWSKLLPSPRSVL